MGLNLTPEEIKNLTLNVTSGGIVGLITSLAASLIFRKQTNGWRSPKLKISDVLLETKRSVDNKPALQIKVLNHTKQNLSNVKILVEGIVNKSPANHTALYQYTLIAQRELLYLLKYERKDRLNYAYATLINLFNDSNIIQDVKKYNKIRISISADCPYYNTSAIKLVEYSIPDNICDSSYKFNTGNNLHASC